MTGVIQKLGFIINPTAGMGGPAALKGSDGADAITHARARGIQPIAPARALRALQQLKAPSRRIQWLTCQGEMGERVAAEAGLTPTCLAVGGADPTTSRDTRDAARWMASEAVDLILFAGGDGTARDIVDVKAIDLPVLGIPCGVKMHSAVFGTSPEATGRLLQRLLESQTPTPDRLAEVMDIDEDAFRHNRLSARLYGYMPVPEDHVLVQSAKASYFGSDTASLDAAARELASELFQDWAYIIGPGATAKKVLNNVGLEGTLLGVDVLLNGDMVARDADVGTLRAIVSRHRSKIIVGIIGGQGHIFGRGNQQIGADIIRSVGRDNLIIIAGRSKLADLRGRPLIADSGDAAVDTMLSGFLRVRTGPGQTAIMPVT
jgi:predicted polyphosphate/ATP-dependent NAD kinase